MQTTDLQVDVIIPTQTNYLNLIGSIGEHIGKELDSYNGDKEALAYQLNLVLTEATTNAIKHSNNDDPKDTVRVKITIKDEQLTIEVFDHGQGFNLDAVPLPDLEQPKEGGMGIFLIRKLMDSVVYKDYDQGHVLEMVKSLKISS